MCSLWRQARQPNLIAFPILFLSLMLAGSAAAQDETPRRGMLGLGLGLGFALGGDDLLEVEFDNGDDTTLSAGNGLVADIGVLVNPLWIGQFGLGATVNIGIKYAGIEAANGSASFTRFPLVVAPRAMYQLGANWSILASGGLHYDLGASLSGDGVLSGLDLDSDSALGWMIEAGAYFEEFPLAFDVTLRYTALHYELGGMRVDAGSVGLFGAFHYFLL